MENPDLDEEARGYVSRVFNSNGGVLRLENSDVRLTVPENAIPQPFLYSLDCKVHKNVEDYVQYLDTVPGETFVSPVVEVFIKAQISVLSPNVFAQTASSKSGCVFQEHVTLSIPHCVQDKSLWKHIEVHYIETDYDLKATRVPTLFENGNGKEGNTDCFFTVKENRVEIHTKHFTKFWCTCSPLKNHEIQMEAVVFGFHELSSSSRLQIVNIKTYLCDALYHIRDYKQVCTLGPAYSDNNYIQM